MKTYIFFQKNGSGTLALSANDETEAWNELELIVKHPSDWRLVETEPEDED